MRKALSLAIDIALWAFVGCGLGYLGYVLGGM